LYKDVKSENVPELTVFMQSTNISDTIWKPPLIIGNSATTFKMIGMKDSYIKVVNTGLVLWQPGESIIFTCSIDSTYFPFDTQICKFSL
jgi:nicotinic acetylcholine receptor